MFGVQNFEQETLYHHHKCSTTDTHTAPCSPALNAIIRASIQAGRRRGRYDLDRGEIAGVKCMKAAASIDTERTPRHSQCRQQARVPTSVLSAPNGPETLAGEFSFYFEQQPKRSTLPLSASVHRECPARTPAPLRAQTRRRIFAQYSTGAQ